MQFGAAVVVCAETSTGCLIGGDAIAISKPQVRNHVLLMMLLISDYKIILIRKLCVKHIESFRICT